jgi:hypothetical protein
MPQAGSFQDDNLQLPLLQRFKRFILILLLVLMGWSAVLMALAIYSSGRTNYSIAWTLRTTLAQGFLLLVSFGAFTALERVKLRIPAIVGMLSAALMLTLLPIFDYWQITDAARIRQFNQVAHDGVYQLAQTGFLTAGLLCLIPFILLPRMRRVGRIVQMTTIVYLSFAYGAAILYLWHIDTQRIEEALTMLLIPAGACMLGVFALHKFLGIRQPDSLSSVAPTLSVRCPRCQSEQSLALGESRCSCCRLRFSIAVEEPRCPNCHFNLHQLTRPICPECGFHLDAEDVPAESGATPVAPAAHSAAVSAAAPGLIPAADA